MKKSTYELEVGNILTDGREVKVVEISRGGGVGMGEYPSSKMVVLSDFSVERGDAWTTHVKKWSLK